MAGKVRGFKMKSDDERVTNADLAKKLDQLGMQLVWTKDALDEQAVELMRMKYAVESLHSRLEHAISLLDELA